MPSGDVIQTAGKYVIAIAVLVGCFGIIYQSAAGTDNSQSWTVIGLIVGWIVRDSAGQSATVNAVKTLQAQR